MDAKRIYDPDRNNFGPHAGFAWALDAERRASLRAGYGIYYDVVLGAVVSQSRNVFPNEIPINVDPNFLGFDLLRLNNPVFLALNRDANNNPVVPVVRLLAQGSCNQFGTCNQFGGAPQDFAALIGQLFIQNRNGGLAFTLPQKKLRTPYAQQWHLTFERELPNNYLFSAAYVGTKGTKLLRLTTPNRGPNVTPQIEVVPPNLPLQPFPLLNIPGRKRDSFSCYRTPIPAPGAAVFQLVHPTRSFVWSRTIGLIPSSVLTSFSKVQRIPTITHCSLKRENATAIAISLRPLTPDLMRSTMSRTSSQLRARPSSLRTQPTFEPNALRPISMFGIASRHHWFGICRSFEIPMALPGNS